MAKINYLNLQSFLREKIKDTNLNKKATSIALGVAISRMLPITSTSVENVESHYSSNLVHAATLMVSEFNENIVVDVDLVADTARNYWLMRYNNVYPNLDVPMIPFGEFGFICKLNNLGRYITPDIYKFCNDNSEMMVVIINRITAVMKDKETK